jgi:hypothetical protein
LHNVSSATWSRGNAIALIWSITGTTTLVDLILNPLLSPFERFSLAIPKSEIAEYGLLFERQDATNANLLQRPQTNGCCLGFSKVLRPLFD